MSDSTQTGFTQAERDEMKAQAKELREKGYISAKPSSKPYNASDTRFAYFARVQAGTENR
ncbi:MAG: hypothetical protein CTY12_03335 [Methylotenera sp.]|nr:MAG: hypothetical protein CTY12_03335 [Methylotenera sp.]